MKLLNYFPWSNEAWDSYARCRSTLWWPLSYLFLAPLAVLIIFGAIIPLSLFLKGWISFDHSFINYPYIVFVSSLVFFALVPFIDGLYRLIKDQLAGNEFDENTAFKHLRHSKPMAIAMGPILLGILLLEFLGSLFLPFKLAALVVYLLAVFTPILCVYDSEISWKKAWESIQFAMNNKKLVLQVWGMRFLILLALLLPWVIVALTGSHKALKALTILLAIPSFVYLFVKIVPFYFYYPAYVHKQIEQG
jgi:hypothetical protein